MQFVSTPQALASSGEKAKKAGAVAAAQMSEVRLQENFPSSDTGLVLQSDLQRVECVAVAALHATVMESQYCQACIELLDQHNIIGFQPIPMLLDQFQLLVNRLVQPHALVIGHVLGILLQLAFLRRQYPLEFSSVPA